MIPAVRAILAGGVINAWLFLLKASADRTLACSCCQGRRSLENAVTLIQEDLSDGANATAA